MMATTNCPLAGFNIRVGLFFLTLVLTASVALAQDESILDAVPGPIEAERVGDVEFTLIRGKYANYAAAATTDFESDRWNRQWWQTDFADADQNLLRGVRRLTTVDTSAESYKAVALTDPELFEHPFLYINMKRIPLSGGNGPNFSQPEAAALREYMLRGGFVMLDDFWGEAHWQDFLTELNKIFPDRPLRQLKPGHPLFHCFFDIRQIMQVPGRGVTWNYGWGFTLENQNYPPAVHGLFDPNERLMMVVNFNTDLGDGLEHTYDRFYPTRYSNAAYKLAINTIIYAMSH
jgi:hypothetical protein